MAQSNNTSNQPQQAAPAQQGNASGSGSSGGNRRMLIFVVIGIIVVVAIVLVVLAVTSAPGAPAISQTSSQNSTEISMSASQAQTVIGSSIANYNVSDLYNPNSFINITDLVSIVPQLYGNATSGWVTSAQGSNTAANTSLEYVVITTRNASQMASLINTAVTSGLPMTTQTVNSGNSNGLSYTYGSYTNSTADLQILTGWRSGDAVLVLVTSNPTYSVNETALISATANATP